MDLPCPWCDGLLDPAAVDGARCPRCGRQLVVMDRYQVRAVLGRGGMATVYEARDRDGHRVAVKVLRLGGEPAGGDAWSAWSMFERSSRVLMGLDHPRLPKVHHFEQHPSGRLLLVREIFDGGTLAERIDSERRLDARQMHRLAKELLELLQYLHGLVPPVIHRDIKPANVMFRSAGDWDPVLVDFDSIAAPEGQRTGLTVVATVGYAAPEQFAGEATPTSDLYGAGATLLHLATRVPPDRLPRAHGRYRLEGLLDELDPGLRAVLPRLVEPDPGKRYPDAGAALADLARGKKQPAAAAAASPAAGPSPSLKTGARTAVLLTLALVGVGIYFGVTEAEPSWLQRETRDCAAKVAKSCWELGTHYEDGKGVTRDLARAVTLYRQSCELRYGKACVYLADMLAWGKGTTVDHAGATAAYLRACDGGGQPRSCQIACTRIKGGDGVAPDPQRALGLCKRSCDSGDSFGCNDLALFYRDGVAVPKDEARAETLFDGACGGGDALACHNLARMVAPRDPARARGLERKACDAKISDACDALRAAQP